MRGGASVRIKRCVRKPSRKLVGEWPVTSLKTRLKWVSDWNPTSKAISDTRTCGLASSVFRRFHPGAGDVGGEGQAGGFPELPAEITAAQVRAVGDLLEFQRLGEVLADELAGAVDVRSLGVFAGEEQLVGDQSQVAGEDVKQLEDGSVMLG